jgi:hypothetical protein
VRLAGKPCPASRELTSDRRRQKAIDRGIIM